MQHLRLKKSEDRRIRAGHPWIYSNEIDTTFSPLKNFKPGEEVIVEAQDQSPIGIAYVNPRSLITGRLLVRGITEVIDQQWFTQRIQQALQLRTQLFDKPFYRLIFGEADGLPGLVIDRSANDFVVQFNTAGMDSKRDFIIKALQIIFTDIRSILLRNDSSIREHEGLSSSVEPAFGVVPDEIQLEENNVQFITPLLTGQKTGWFYDHRVNRARMKDYVQNKTVLDVFSYLGGWGIQAATLGANDVTCLDCSALACEYVKKNAALNKVDDKITTICDDAFNGMKALIAAGKTYDVIVIDPPAFVKRAKDLKEGLIAYQRINEFALKLLVPGGILFSCSCSMQVSMDDLTNVLMRAAARQQVDLQILERGHQAPDHPVHVAIPETDYLKMIVARKR